jgi:hypothetical protein
MAGVAVIKLALADELDADRLAAAPDHFAVSPRPGVARKRQPQFGGQHIGIVDRDLRPGRGDILHHALTRREAAVERDPAGLAQRFAHFPLLGNSGHFELLLKARRYPNRPKESLRNREIQGCLPCPGGDPPAPKNRFPGGLPGRANATIRSPAATGIHAPGSGDGTAPSQPQSVDVPGICLLSKRNGDAPTGRLWRGGRFSSLRLSVRTPPFHGGESGSIPLGSASNFNGLAPAPSLVSNVCPINECGLS